MRKALLIAFTCLAGITSQAQVEKGRTLLGGTIAYNQSTNYSDGNYLSPGKQRSVIISPSFGKAIKTNFVLGVEASFSSGNQTYGAATDAIKTKSHSYGGAIFLRQYVPLLKNFYFYAQGMMGGSKNEAKQTHNNRVNNRTEGWGVSASLSPGLTYAITKKLYVESGLNGFALLAYSHSKLLYTDATTGGVSVSKGNNFNFSTSLGSSGGFTIGFRVLL